MNSRAKGARGELEFAHFLKDRGIEARRGQQYAGGAASPDVVAGGAFQNVHFEVNRVQAGNPYNWLAQAQRDAKPGSLPVVAHRKNDKEWIAILDMDEFVKIIKRLENAQHIK